MIQAVEAKVAAQSSVGIVTGVVTWILVTFVPTLHHGLPGPLGTFLPYVVSIVLGGVSGYLAPHTPRTAAPAPAPVTPAPAPVTAPQP